MSLFIIVYTWYPFLHATSTSIQTWYPIWKESVIGYPYVIEHDGPKSPSLIGKSPIHVLFFVYNKQVTRGFNPHSIDKPYSMIYSIVYQYYVFYHILSISTIVYYIIYESSASIVYPSYIHHYPLYPHNTWIMYVISQFDTLR